MVVLRRRMAIQPKAYSGTEAAYGATDGALLGQQQTLQGPNPLSKNKCLVSYWTLENRSKYSCWVPRDADPLRDCYECAVLMGHSVQCRLSRTLRNYSLRNSDRSVRLGLGGQVKFATNKLRALCKTNSVKHVQVRTARV
eukprot:1530461-Rhodomonas_salina.3